ncbi:unnamed protein product [Acanthosepion pharaonis]|uniref:Uncharacterized protein n=1 Tax=Acanthosepion pharaonis TaxID=158019 RepID=A0A812BJG0_ACAPH|nr:unnamed protein product [Sepia pharaonis]
MINSNKWRIVCRKVFVFFFSLFLFFFDYIILYLILLDSFSSNNITYSSFSLCFPLNLSLLPPSTQHCSLLFPCLVFFLFHACLTLINFKPLSLHFLYFSSFVSPSSLSSSLLPLPFFSFSYFNCFSSFSSGRFSLLFSLFSCLFLLSFSFYLFTDRPYSHSLNLNLFLFLSFISSLFFSHIFSSYFSHFALLTSAHFHPFRFFPFYISSSSFYFIFFLISSFLCPLHYFIVLFLFIFPLPFFPPFFVFLIQYFVFFVLLLRQRLLLFFFFLVYLILFCVLFFIIPSYLTFSSPPLHYSLTILLPPLILPHLIFYFNATYSSFFLFLFPLFSSIFSQIHPFFLFFSSYTTISFPFSLPSPDFRSTFRFLKSIHLLQFLFLSSFIFLMFVLFPLLSLLHFFSSFLLPHLVSNSLSIVLISGLVLYFLLAFLSLPHSLPFHLCPETFLLTSPFFALYFSFFYLPLHSSRALISSSSSVHFIS